MAVCVAVGVGVWVVVGVSVSVAVAVCFAVGVNVSVAVMDSFYTIQVLEFNVPIVVFLRSKPQYRNEYPINLMEYQV